MSPVVAPPLSSWRARARPLGILVLGTSLLVAFLHLHYLLFHTVVEMVSVGVSWAVFAITWNAREVIEDPALTVLGVAFVVVGWLDLLHTLAYKGMGVFSQGGVGTAAELWLAARMVHAAAILAALAVRPPARPRWPLPVFGLSGVALTLSVFSGVFPEAFRPGTGLTDFKLAAEGLLTLAFLAAGAWFLRERQRFGNDVSLLLAGSAVCQAASETAFTLYAGPTDMANATGHFLKLAACYLTYRAIVVTGVARPRELLFRRLREREAALRRSHQVLEERVAERTAALEKIVRELDDFAHVVAHDLREPLRGIHNLVGFLADDLGGRIDPEHRSMLETLSRLSRRMDEQVQAIHRFARVGREGMDIAPTDLNRLMEAVRESLQVLLTERNGELRVAQLPTVSCDRVLVQDLFRNLVANGIKYNESAVPRVEVGVSDGETCPVFTVRDNGIGIPFDRQEEIFTIFRRLHPADAYGGGTGAGLAIARRIVRRHGGWIWFESVPGDGTTFFFTLEGYCEHRDGPPAHSDR